MARDMSLERSVLVRTSFLRRYRAAAHLRGLGAVTNDTALVDVRNEVLRKIGRNLVNFQKMEGMLKFLNIQQVVSGIA